MTFKILKANLSIGKVCELPFGRACFLTFLSLIFRMTQMCYAQDPNLTLTYLEETGEYSIDVEQGTVPSCGIYRLEFALIVAPDSSQSPIGSPDVSFFISSQSWLFDVGDTEITVNEEVLSNGRTRYAVQVERNDQELQVGFGEAMRFTVETGILIALDDFPDKRHIASRPEAVIQTGYDSHLIVMAESPVTLIKFFDLDGQIIFQAQPDMPSREVKIPIDAVPKNEILIVEIGFSSGRPDYRKIILGR